MSLLNIAVPNLAYLASPPEFASLRGLDCRAFNRRQDREVYGLHPFAFAHDAGITNGLIRAWCGPQGPKPYLTVQAFGADSWWNVGHLGFVGPQDAPLQRVRITVNTPEQVTLELDALNISSIQVSLRRGERMIRVEHGDALDVRSAGRYMEWMGVPPVRRRSE